MHCQQALTHTKRMNTAFHILLYAKESKSFFFILLYSYFLVLIVIYGRILVREPIKYFPFGFVYVVVSKIYAKLKFNILN